MKKIAVLYILLLTSCWCLFTLTRDIGEESVISYVQTHHDPWKTLSYSMPVELSLIASNIVSLPPLEQPEEEICRRLPELVGWIDDESIRVEMAKVLRPEWIVVSEEGLTVQFPAGSLSSFEDQAYLICVEPQKVMEAELLQPWAIPYNW